MPFVTRLYLIGLTCTGLLVAAAVLSLHVERTARGSVTQIYDGVVEPLARLSTAQARIEIATATLKAATVDASPGQEVRLSAQEWSDLRTAIGAFREDIRAFLSAPIRQDTHDAISALRYPLNQLNLSEGRLSHRAAISQLGVIEKSLEDGAAEIARDLESYREDTLDTLAERRRMAIAGIAIASAIVLAGIFFLARSLRRRMQGLATVSARVGFDGRPETIAVGGPYETRTVLNHLAEADRRMSTSLEASRRHAETLATQLDLKSAQMTVALENMTQALCMLDARRRLVVCNSKFSRFFGNHAVGTQASRFLPDAEVTAPLAANQTAVMRQETSRNEILEVKRTGLAGDGLLITFEDVTERERIADRLEHVSAHDRLTNLPNRSRFIEIVDETIGKRNPSFSLLVLDLHNFKSVNSNHGHQTGDKLLVAVTERLEEIDGAVSSLARLGGDKFGLLANDGRVRKPIAKLADKIIAAFAEPFDVDGLTIKLGVNVGAIHADGAMARSELKSEFLLDRCDLAVDTAKAESEVSWCLYDETMADRQRERREMEADLRTALANNEFGLVYQPFVDTETMSVTGFEALLRWYHPERGTVSPAIFIPMMERIELIEEVGLWCVRTACTEASRWLDGKAISVNFSPVQFKSRTLVAEIDRILRESNLDAGRLQVEVTESLFIGENDHILATLKGLHDLGVTISMDDFGTGYSSLGYLSRYPFHKIKIDQSFIRDLARPENMAIVRSVIGLSKNLGMAVLAEGIETPEQMRILSAGGCREMQGFLFSKPRPAGELPAMMAEFKTRWQDGPEERASSRARLSTDP